MAESDTWDDLLHDFQQVIIGTLPNFPGGQRRRRVGDEGDAKTVLHASRSNEIMKGLGQIDDLFRAGGGDVQRSMEGRPVRHRLTKGWTSVTVQRAVIAPKADEATGRDEIT